MTSNNTTVRKIFFLLLPFFISSKCEAQNDLCNSPFGQGVITIGQFNFSPETLVPSGAVDITGHQNFYNFTYFIKGNKILRKDKPDSSQQRKFTDTLSNNEIIQTTTLKLTAGHPVYLIDWGTKMTYAFFTKKGQSEISAKPLHDEQLEWFYRLSDNDKTVIKEIGKTTPILISGKKCYSGLAILKNGDSASFYYTDEPLKVKSPLNRYLPSDFEYNVLYIKLGIDWTTDNGKKTKGTIVLQVTEIHETPLSDTLFLLPKNVPIRSNVSWKEIFSPE